MPEMNVQESSSQVGLEKKRKGCQLIMMNEIMIVNFGDEADTFTLLIRK